MQIDTKELLEIHQVFSHTQDANQVARPAANGARKGGARFSENRTATNDYAVIVLKINSPELRQFYGNGHYIVQVWRNKKRLYQHVHNCKCLLPIIFANVSFLLDDIRKIYLGATEFCYLLNMQEKRNHVQQSRAPPDETFDSKETTVISVPRDGEHYDAHLNFIFVVQPFTCGFARILYPLDNEDSLSDTGSQKLPEDESRSEPVLFINDELLIVGEGYQIRYCNTDQFSAFTQGRNAPETE